MKKYQFLYSATLKWSHGNRVLNIHGQ